MRTWRRIEEIFRSIGFDVADGPEIETDWMSFTALNNPENHPARSMQDTFYVDVNDADGRPLNLRPHTSPMQVRYARMHAAAVMAGAETDVRVIAPGRTYRIDSDATHSPMFHQVEGLWLGDGHLVRRPEGRLHGVPRRVLRDATRCRCASGRRTSRSPSRRPRSTCASTPDRSPAAGSRSPVRARCIRRSSRNFGLDPERHIGFAFGSGIERLAMLRYGIDDLRLFYDGDLRFLEQFH